MHVSKKHVLALVYFLLLVLPLFLFTAESLGARNASFMQVSFKNEVTLGTSHAQLVRPGPDLALVNWTANRVTNFGFERWSGPYDADGWREYITGEAYQWVATQPSWPVSEGTYSGGMECFHPLGNSEGAAIEQSFIGADMAALNLTFDWYLHQNEDPTNDYFYMRLRLLDGGTNYYMHYYLNRTWTVSSNASNHAYFRTPGPSYQWNRFNRNITEDFLSVLTFPGYIGANLKLHQISFSIYFDGGSPQYVRAFVDDVNLITTTNGYIWIGGATNNGDFETGNFSPWWHWGNTETGYIRPSPTAYAGSQSANITAISHGNESTAQLSEDNPNARLTSQNPGTLSLWWHLSFQQAVTDVYSYIYISCRNATDQFSLVYLVGYGGVMTVFGNWTSMLTFKVENFNTTGSWIQFRRNLWDDATSYFHTNELYIGQISVVCRSMVSGSRVVTLVDNVFFRAGALNGAGFEDQRAPGETIRGWSYWAEYPQFTVTDTAFAGSKAANLTLSNGGSLYIQQPMQWRPLNSTRETYLDVTWYLDDYTPTANDYIYFEVRFIDGRRIFYFLAIQTIWGSNTSSYGYFNVTGVSTMSTWVGMHRDLTHDYEAVFGSLPDTEITYLTLAGGTTSTNRIEILLDDLFLYDDPAPRISNVFRTPTVPNHNEPVVIEADAIDQDLEPMRLYYQVDGGTWHQLVMGHQSGDTYSATIPGHPWDSSINYYLNASDAWGMSTRAPGGTNVYSYTVADLEDPTVSITSPSSGADVSGVVTVTVDASDAESGIDWIEFLIDSGTVYSDTSTPFEYTWDTTTVSDGSHSIMATAYDHSGRTATHTITVTVINAPPVPPGIPGFPVGAVVLGISVALGLSILIRRRRQRKC